MCLLLAKPGGRAQAGQYLQAVNDISFTVPAGGCLSIVGESGCGKSTVARLVTGLHHATSGEMRFAPGKSGAPLSAQMIFQDPYASLNPRWRVKNIIAEPLRELKLRSSAAEVTERVEELLLTVGLSPSDGEKFPHEFSGGQRQRISIARALASEPEFLVCDEPTSALDVSVQAQVLNLMRRLQDELGLTYLFISHDMSVVRHMSDRIAVMYLGRIVEEGDTEELLPSRVIPTHSFCCRRSLTSNRQTVIANLRVAKCQVRSNHLPAVPFIRAARLPWSAVRRKCRRCSYCQTVPASPVTGRNGGLKKKTSKEAGIQLLCFTPMLLADRGKDRVSRSGPVRIPHVPDDAP